MKKHCNIRTITKRGQLTFDEALMLETRKGPVRMNAFRRYVYSSFEPTPFTLSHRKKQNPRTQK